MDIDIDFEEDIRERLFEEREKAYMILEIDGLKLNIPEEILEEREYYFDFKTREENIEDIKNTHSALLKCFFRNNNSNSTEGYNDKLIRHLESELAIFK